MMANIAILRNFTVVLGPRFLPSLLHFIIPIVVTLTQGFGPFVKDNL